MRHIYAKRYTCMGNQPLCCNTLHPTRLEAQKCERNLTHHWTCPSRIIVREIE